jgi:hypothetical protein
VNLYAYVGNDPITYIDPFGLERGGRMEQLLEWAEWYADITDVRPRMGYVNPDGSVSTKGIGGALGRLFRSLERIRRKPTVPARYWLDRKAPTQVTPGIHLHVPRQNRTQHIMMNMADKLGARITQTSQTRPSTPILIITLENMAQDMRIRARRRDPSQDLTPLDRP